MCLAIPGKILEISESGGIKMCKVDFGGVTQDACIETVPEAKIGDYIIVHAGFALNILSEEEANATLDILHQLEMIDTEIRANEAQVE